MSTRDRMQLTRDARQMASSATGEVLHILYISVYITYTHGTYM